MIVHDFNVARADGTLRPLETDAQLIVDANAVLGRARACLSRDTRHSAPPILLSPHRDPSRRARSLVLGCGARHVRGADAFEREAVARALIDDAAQLLGEGDPGVAAGGRRPRGYRVGGVVGAGLRPG